MAPTLRLLRTNSPLLYFSRRARHCRRNSKSPCLLTYCPDEGEMSPPLEVICDRCGLWRDPQTARIVEVIVVETREEVEESLVKARRRQR